MSDATNWGATPAAAAYRVSDRTDRWEKTSRCGEGRGVRGDYVEADETSHLFHLRFRMSWELKSGSTSDEQVVQ